MGIALPYRSPIPVFRNTSRPNTHIIGGTSGIGGIIAVWISTTFSVAALRLRVALAFLAASLRFFAAVFRFRVALAFLAASRRFCAATLPFFVVAALMPAARCFLLAAAFWPAARCFRVAAAFFAAELRCVTAFMVWEVYQNVGNDTLFT
jgi:hypothetical protein